MATDPANGVKVYLSLDAADISSLAAIRHWDNLKVGTEEGIFWVRDFFPDQWESALLKTLPFKNEYMARDGKLFPRGSRLPARNIPAVLWTSIERGLPLTMPSLNHHYFGLREKLSIELIPSSSEKEVAGMLVHPTLLKNYVQEAPAIRLKQICWVLAGDEALLLGSPLLPLQGQTFWKTGDFLIATGYEPSLPLLLPVLQEMINPDGDHWIVVQPGLQWWLVPKNAFEFLSRSSFKKTMHE
jgi:hypothetical protein